MEDIYQFLEQQEKINPAEALKKVPQNSDAVCDIRLFLIDKTPLNQYVHQLVWEKLNNLVQHGQYLSDIKMAINNHFNKQ